jgi:hypothetical protein
MISHRDMPWFLRCTREFCAYIVMTDRLLNIGISNLAYRQFKEYWEPVSGYSRQSCSIWCPMVELPVHLNFDHMYAKDPALPQIVRAASHTQTEVLEYHLDCLIAKCDWQIYSARSVITNRNESYDICPIESGAPIKVDEFCFVFRNASVASCFRCTSNSQLMIDWSPMLHHFHNSTHAIYHAIGQPEELLMSCINSLHLK